MQQETRIEVVERFLRFVQEADDPLARALANDWVNTALRSIWQAHPFAEFVLPVDPTLTTVAGQANYVLPAYFGRVAGRDGLVRNLATGAKIYPIQPIDLQERHPRYGSALDTEQNDPSHYTITGKVGVQVQVAAAGEALEALSSDSGDTDIQLQLEGLLSGEWQSATFTLAGTTPVALGTWTYVQTVSKGYPAGTDPITALTSSRGTITVRKVTGAVTRATLLPAESSREQYQMRFFPTPQAAQSIAVPTIRLMRRLINDADPVPLQWADAVFEEMHYEYLVQTGAMTRAQADQAPRPKRDLLIGYDNERKPQVRRFKRAFGVGR